MRKLKPIEQTSKFPWITGMANQGDGFVPEHIGVDGAPYLGSMAALSPRGGMARSERNRHVDLDLHTLELATNDDDFVSAWPQLSTARHQVFRHRTENHVLFISASVLLPALIGRIAPLGRYLFVSGGLDAIGFPVQEDGKWRVERIRDRVRAFKDRDESIAERLLWFMTFPSARRAWNSVYFLARQGVLGVSLPSARVALSVKVQKSGSSMLALSCTVMALTPLENPFPFAASLAGHQFVLHDHFLSRRIPPEPPPTPYDRSLSDWEWEIMRAIVGGHRFRKEATREILRVAMHRALTGRPGSAYGPYEHSRCNVLRNSLMKSGYWNTLLSVFRAMRDAESKT